MFALTPWRLGCGYPNGRKPTHESTCGACGSAAGAVGAFVLPAVLFPLVSPIAVDAAHGGLHRSTYLPTCCVTYASPNGHTSRDAGGGRFKGISTIFDCDAGWLVAESENYEARHAAQRRENYRPAYTFPHLGCRTLQIMAASNSSGKSLWGILGFHTLRIDVVCFFLLAREWNVFYKLQRE